MLSRSSVQRTLYQNAMESFFGCLLYVELHMNSIHVHPPMPTLSCAPIHVHLYMCTYTCAPIHVYLYMCTYTCAPIHVYLYMPTLSCAPIHVYLHICIHTVNPCAPTHELQHTIPSLETEAAVTGVFCRESSIYLQCVCVGSSQPIIIKGANPWCLT